MSLILWKNVHTVDESNTAITKLSQLKKSIFYFSFTSFTSICNYVFLFYVGLNLMQEKKGGGVLCGIVFGLDPFLEIAVGPVIARYIDSIEKIRDRMRTAFYIHLTLMVCSLTFAFLNPQHPFAFIFLLFLIRLMTLFDTQLKAIFPLYLDNQNILSLTRSLSFNILFQRCIILMSPSLAFLAIGFSWFALCIVNSLSYLLSLFGIYLTLKMIPPTEGASRIDEGTSAEKKKWVNWNCLFLLLTGIAFGSLSLILTKSMLISSDEPLAVQIFRGPAPIYLGFLIAWILTLTFSPKLVFLTKSASRFCLVILIMGLLLICTPFVTFYWRVGIFLSLGILNGINIVVLNTFFQRRIGVKGFTKAIAKSQACAKSGILLALFWGGFCIDADFAPQSILVGSGILGITVSIFLLLFSARTERSTSTIH
ncbi:MAG: hypothetical protein JJU12_00890 [Chlamydiales bacterium]|nr:hypothetical protein [Chlamydiales bacterium]